MGDQSEILLVEDNPTDAELALRALAKSGFGGRLLVARDGEEALDLVFARGAWADRTPGRGLRAILLDLKLPKVDGLEVLRALRADSRTRWIPVIILSSSRVPADIEACYRAGANSYVVKPVEYTLHASALRNLGQYWGELNETADL